jgi:hypothetical protein
LGEADGTTTVKISDQAYDDQSGAETLSLDLAANASVAEPVGPTGFTVPNDSDLYVFCTVAEGGHEGLQLSVQLEEV